VTVTGGRPRRLAVFLDRDGTIIEDVGYLRDPAAARLLPGAAQAITRLNQRDFLVIVATNQSGIARGLLSRNDYLLTEKRIDALLRAEGARLDAHYFCPHLPELTGPCDCRKPGVLLYRQAAEQFNIDLPRSWWIGDRVRDVQPAEIFGARGILLDGAARETDDENGGRIVRARDLSAAVDFVLREAAPGS
jgi:D-glycero-D-manno-heptose 1,7-bisphosphate phosphatase